MSSQISKFLVLSSFCCIVSFIIVRSQHSYAQTLSKEQFKKTMEKVLAEKDSTRFLSLVKEYRYQVVWFVNELLKSYVSSEIFLNKQNSVSNLANARLLANLYQTSFSSEILAKRVWFFSHWSVKEKEAFLKGDSLKSRADKFVAETQFSQALKLFRRALVSFQKVGDEFMVGECLLGIGAVHRNLRNIAASIDTLKIALEINRKHENRRVEGNTLRELGVSTYLSNDREKALSHWKSALKIFRELPEKMMEGMTLGHIGVYYRSVGQPFEALKYYEQALKIAQELNNKANEAIVLNNIANIKQYLGNYEETEKYMRQALEIIRELSQKPREATLLNNLGHNAKLRGDYQKSLKYYHDCLNLRAQLEDSVGIGITLMNEGVTYLDLMINDKAWTKFDEALKIFKKHGVVKLEALTFLNLGVIYERREEHNKALDFYNSALALSKQNDFQDYVGLSLNNIGAIHEQLGEYPQAEENFKLALNIYRERNEPPGQIGVLKNLGQLSIKKEEYLQAIKYFSQAIEIGGSMKPLAKPWDALFGIGQVYEKQDKKEEALKWYAESIEAIESIRSKLTIESLKESFMEDKIEVYEAIIKLLLDLGRKEEAFNYLERAKARNLLDILSIERIHITQGISSDLLEKKEEVEWRLRQVNELLTKEFSKKEKERDSQYVATLEDSLKKVRFQHEEIIQEIKLNHPRYAQLTGIKNPLNLREIQSKVLNKDETLVEYLVTDEQVYVGIVTNNKLNFISLNVSKAELTEIVTRLLQPFRDVKTGKIKNLIDVGYNLKLAQELYYKIFQPMESYLSNDESIIIVSDDILHYLPFEALVTEIEKKSHPMGINFSRFENAHYLIEKYAISYVHSASVLEPEILNRHSKKVKGLLALGNPQFGEGDGLISEEEKERGILHIFDFLTRGPEANTWTFKQLPASEDEVREVCDIVKPSKYFIGSDAIEEIIKETASQYQYIHISSHAVPEEKQPMYSRVVLAHDNDPKEDGYLHAFEILNLDLNADLVALIACETALGKYSRGEGLIGLTRAFMYAGASSVLVSLWKVDEYTSKLMKHFYKNLNKGMSKSKALRQAKLKLLKTREERMSFAHPYLWASFVLVGEKD